MSHPNLFSRVFVALALACTLAFAACSEDPDPASVEHSFVTLVAAIEAHDADTMWALTSSSFKEFCAELHRDLSEAGRLVQLYFPEWEQERLLQRLAWHRLGDADGPKALFARLVDFDRVRTGDAIRAGLEHDTVIVQGNRATIMTKAREKFSFVREEDGVWRTDIYDRARGFPLVETLRENIDTLRSNVKHLQGMYATGTDPKTPEGAFNQFRQALESADGGVLNKLLDQPARKALGELRNALAELRTKPSSVVEERLAAAELAGIDLDKATRSQRSLLKQLARRSTLSVLMGVATDSKVHLVRVESRSEASVITTDAEEFPLVREDDGLWHLADAGDLIVEGLVAPLRQD